MDIPEPVPGLVIRYAYLWADQHRSGLDEGNKDRPVAVVVATEVAQGLKRVLVVPITHAQPHEGQTAIEIPPATKKRLGLDEARSWVMLDEVNVFGWPGPDVRPVPGSSPSTIAYGQLPANLTTAIRDALLAIVRDRRLMQVPRTD